MKSYENPSKFFRILVLGRGLVPLCVPGWLGNAWESNRNGWKSNENAQDWFLWIPVGTQQYLTNFFAVCKNSCGSPSKLLRISVLGRGLVPLGMPGWPGNAWKSNGNAWESNENAQDWFLWIPDGNQRNL